MTSSTHIRTSSTSVMPGLDTAAVALVLRDLYDDLYDDLCDDLSTLGDDDAAEVVAQLTVEVEDMHCTRGEVPVALSGLL